MLNTHRASFDDGPPPTALPAAPRKIRIDPQYLPLLRTLRTFLLLMAVGTAFFAVVVPYSYLHSLSLRELPGEVTAAWKTSGRNPYHLGYDFFVDGVRRHGEGTVDIQQYGSYVDGRGELLPDRPISVYFSRVASLERVEIHKFEYELVLPAGIGAGSFMALALLYFAWKEVRLRRFLRLYTTGEVIRGVVTHKTSVPRRIAWNCRQDLLYIHYAFSAGGKSFTGRTAVRQSVCDRFSPGDPVTVLYLPTNPRWSAIYEEGGVSIDGASPASACNA